MILDLLLQIQLLQFLFLQKLSVQLSSVQHVVDAGPVVIVPGPSSKLVGIAIPLLHHVEQLGHPIKALADVLGCFGVTTVAEAGPAGTAGQKLPSNASHAPHWYSHTSNVDWNGTVHALLKGIVTLLSCVKSAKF